MTEIKHIFRQLVKCVNHIHSKGIIHGDIKTLNLVRTGAQVNMYLHIYLYIYIYIYIYVCID
jgi:serine/threonine protein kinase